MIYNLTKNILPTLLTYNSQTSRRMHFFFIIDTFSMYNLFFGFNNYLRKNTRIQKYLRQTNSLLYSGIYILKCVFEFIINAQYKGNI